MTHGRNWFEVRSKTGRIVHTFEGSDAKQRADTFAKAIVPHRDVFYVEVSEMRVVS